MCEEGSNAILMLSAVLLLLGVLHLHWGNQSYREADRLNEEAERLTRRMEETLTE
jgi:hypothetical protein